MIVAFIVFLMTQVIWGEMLREALIPRGLTPQEAYIVIGGILWIGLAFLFGASLISGLFIFHKQYYKKPIMMAALLAWVVALILLVIISYLGMAILYKGLWSRLTIVEELQLIGYYYIFFSVYVLGNPVIFWYIALGIYHVALIIFIKLIYKKRTPRGRRPLTEGPAYTSGMLGERSLRSERPKKRKTAKTPKKKTYKKKR